MRPEPGDPSWATGHKARRYHSSAATDYLQALSKFRNNLIRSQAPCINHRYCESRILLPHQIFVASGDDHGIHISGDMRTRRWNRRNLES